jgi:hypothetical protein
VQVVTELEVCLLCGELADRLTRHRAEERSFAARLPGALLWPLSKAGLIAIAGVALVRAALSYLMGLGWVAGGAVLAATCFAFLRSTARGSDDFDSGDFTDLIPDLLGPGFKALVGASIVWVPGALWVVWRGLTAHDMLKDPVIWLLVIAGAAYAPMAIGVGAAGGSVLGMLNPAHVVKNALKLGSSYFLAVAVLGGLLLPWLLLLGVGAMLNALPVLFVPRVLDYALGCYVPFVAARVLGLLLYTHGDRVGYGMESDYQVSLLGAVAPRGVPPEAQTAAQPAASRHAPIELEPLAAEQGRPGAEPEPQRPRLTELDPAALPPLSQEPHED